MNKIDIVMPRLGTNDNNVTIGSWLVDNGKWVEKGTSIAVLETTKETSELEASQAGYLFYNLDAGSDVAVGKLIAVITDDEKFVFPRETRNSVEQFNITAKARKLAEQYHIDLNVFSGKNIIREKDVMEFIGNENVDIQYHHSQNGIVLVAGGGVAKMCIDVLRATHLYHILGITDKNIPVGHSIMGEKILGSDEILSDLHKNGCMYAVNCIGGIARDNQDNLFFLRKEIYTLIKEKGFLLPNLIHPMAMVEDSARLGDGNLVLAGAIVGSEALIGNNCIINTGAIISHDCKISNHVKVSPGAVLAGNVQVGENSLIGMGVTVYFGVKIGKNVIIANGKHIFENIPDNAVIK